MLIGKTNFIFGTRTYLMGVINVTPDSFSGDGVMTAGELDDDSIKRAVEQARRMQRAGAHLLDIGGQSSRPPHVYGPAVQIGAEQERNRVLPVIKAVSAAVPLPLSIDTAKAAVADAALEAGAALINDVSLLSDPSMPAVAASRGSAILLSHTRAEARYADLMTGIGDDLAAAIAELRRAGVPEERVILDPGIGFAKDAALNASVIRNLAQLKRRFGLPLAIGISRKAFIAKLAGTSQPDAVEIGGAVLAALAIANGADIVRTHNVELLATAASMADAITRKGSADGV